MVEHRKQCLWATDMMAGDRTKRVEELAVDISVTEKMRVYINNRVLAAQQADQRRMYNMKL
jgi:hypothetical protein